MICFKTSIYRKILFGIALGFCGYAVVRWVVNRKQTPLVVIQESNGDPEENTGDNITAIEPIKNTKKSIQKEDDLQVIEGIGPKINLVLKNAGITTYTSIATMDIDQIKTILKAGNVRIFQPETWPEQAKLAAQGKWEELKVFQNNIKAGKVVKS